MSSQVIPEACMRLETIERISPPGDGAADGEGPGAPFAGGGVSGASSPERSLRAISRNWMAFFLRRSSASRPMACSAKMDIRLAAFS